MNILPHTLNCNIKVIKMQMYIFFNNDLQMSKGQIVTQCCHITQVITDELVSQCYEVTPTPKECLDYMKWKQSPTTIVLKATQEQLNHLKSYDNARCFRDSGNRIADDSLTCVGFFPCDNMRDMVKDYKLL